MHKQSNLLLAGGFVVYIFFGNSTFFRAGGGFGLFLYFRCGFCEPTRWLGPLVGLKPQLVTTS